ncbi:MAG: endonuclease/exonuclease/phosphatase family protein [Pseudomonadota bacterium]
MPLPPPDPGRFRLASYNIRKCVGMDMRRQPERILGVLAALKADVVVLQEADRRLPPRPAALAVDALVEAGWDYADLDSPGSLGWHGNAVLWRRAAVELRGTDRIKLPGLEPRGAVRAHLATEIGTLDVVGLHLGLIRSSRRAQIRHLSQMIDGVREGRSVWAGDFNDWAHPSRLLGQLPNLTPLPTGPSFPAPRPVARLDRIALSPDLRAESHGVYAQGDAPIASDHLPVWADLIETSAQ